jgi:hypothetical protein
MQAGDKSVKTIFHAASGNMSLVEIIYADNGGMRFGVTWRFAPSIMDQAELLSSIKGALPPCDMTVEEVKSPEELAARMAMHNYDGPPQ